MSDKAPTFVKDGKAYLRDADGRVFKTDPSAVAAKLAEGDRFAMTAEEYAEHERDKKNSTLGAKLKTGAESAAAGLIDAAQAPIALPLRANAALWGDEDPLKNIGGRATVENIASLWGGATSDRNAEAYGREYAENARDRAERNPGSALAGNIIGTAAAGGPLSGGARAIGAGAAKALGAGLAGRVTGALVAGAAEGAAYGQAQAAEEAYIHNIPLTGEKLIAAMGWGAVLGGGVSLAAEGAGALLRRGSRGATPLDSPRLPEQAELPPPAAVDLSSVAEVNPVQVLPKYSKEELSPMLARAAEHPPTPEEARALKMYSFGHDEAIRAVQRGDTDADIIARRAEAYGGDVDKLGVPHAQHLAEAKEAAGLVNQYIERTPPAGLPRVYRGLVLSPEDAQEFLRRGEFDMGPSVTSVSADPAVARSFVARNLEDGQTGITLRLEDSSARSIQAHAAERVQVEKELLQPGGSRFEITDRYRDASNPDNWIVVAREIPKTEAVTGVAEAAAPGRFSSGLREFADERTAKALGARGSSLKKLGRTAEQAEQTMHDMARTVRGVKLEDGSPVFRALDSQEELAARVAQGKQEAANKLSAFREKADKVFEAHPEIAPKPDAIAGRIEQEIVAPLESHPLSAVSAQAAPVRRLVEDIRGMANAADGAPVKVSDLTRLRQGLDDQIYQAKRGVNLTQQGAPPNLKDLERARGIIEESIEAASDKAATYFDSKAAQSYKQIKTEFRHLLLASDIAGAAELQNLGNRVVSPSDYGVGAAAGVLGGGPIGAVASAFAHKTIREHSSAVMAVLADKLANTLDGKIESGLGSFFREATARSSSATAGLDKVASAVPLKRLVTPAAVEAFQGKSKDLRAAYEKRVAELVDANREMGAGVRASMQAAMGGGSETMPRLTQAATITATRGAQYLEAQLPGGTAAPTVFQPSRKVAPSELQIREFAQKWAAVANPLSVLDDLRRGTVTHAQIDALRAVYPELYVEVQSKALEKIRELDEQGKSMPYNDRLQLDLFLNLNGAGEPTLAGAFVDRVTAMQAAKAQQDAQPKQGSGGGALNKIGASRQSGAQTTLGG